jgi:hypothetical protein
MKIAAITDDGKTISQHFGRAPYYLVVTVEGGEIVERELRDKLGHTHFVNQPHEPELPGQPHGMGSTAHNKHLRWPKRLAIVKRCCVGGWAWALIRVWWHAALSQWLPISGTLIRLSWPTLMARSWTGWTSFIDLDNNI